MYHPASRDLKMLNQLIMPPVYVNLKIMWLKYTFPENHSESGL